jgi:hypothetical protein
MPHGNLPPLFSAIVAMTANLHENAVDIKVDQERRLRMQPRKHRGNRRTDEVL